MEYFEKELNTIRKQFGRNLVYSLLSIFLIYISVFLWLQRTHPDLPQITLSVHILSFVATGYASYLFSKAQINFTTRYTIIGVSFFCLVFYLSLVLCHISNTIYYFYLPIVFLVLCISDFKKTFVVAVCFTILSIYTKSISKLLLIPQPASLSVFNWQILNMLDWFNVLVVAYLSFFLLYYYVEFKKTETILVHKLSQKTVLQQESLQLSNSKVLEISSAANINSEDSKDDKLNVLYQKIISSFEEQNPYQDPNFCIKTLADMLETNTTYVSRALNVYGKKNFSTLVNEYRIAEVKEGLAINLHEKFTLEYVYSKAGFTKQPTFNRVFKEQTGITPSEYIEKLSD